MFISNTYINRDLNKDQIYLYNLKQEYEKKLEELNNTNHEDFVDRVAKNTLFKKSDKNLVNYTGIKNHLKKIYTNKLLNIKTALFQILELEDLVENEFGDKNNIDDTIKKMIAISRDYGLIMKSIEENSSN